MIADQLRAYCDCVDFTDKDVLDMIAVVSLATGWTRFPCETFEKMERREVIDLPACLDCPYEFEPYYSPFDPETFKFSLINITGMDEEETEVDFHYSKYEENFKVDTGLPRCGCTPCECGCPTEYKLLVEYSAGYDEIPDCLLPVFCDLMEVIHAKNSCDCEDCGCDKGQSTYEDGRVTTPKIEYKSGDAVSVFLQTDLGKMLVEQYKNQLASMSLIKQDIDLWGFVV